MGLEGRPTSLDPKQFSLSEESHSHHQTRLPVQKSVWTADLALMLAKFEINIRMYTRYVGVNAMLEDEVCVHILAELLPAKRSKENIPAEILQRRFCRRWKESWTAV